MRAGECLDQRYHSTPSISTGHGPTSDGGEYIEKLSKGEYSHGIKARVYQSKH